MADGRRTLGLDDRAFARDIGGTLSAVVLFIAPTFDFATEPTRGDERRNRPD